MKHCSGCNRDLPISCFHNSHSSKDGKFNRCKECSCKANKKWREKMCENTPLYKVWGGMRQRCLNPNAYCYKDYGGRGIIICERWSSFHNFRDDMESTYKKGLELDRIDNNGNYEPGNCRWATTKEQGRNRRNVLFVCFRGKKIKLLDLLESSGIEKKRRAAFMYHLKRGKSVENIISAFQETLKESK